MTRYWGWTKLLHLAIQFWFPLWTDLERANLNSKPSRSSSCVTARGTYWADHTQLSGSLEAMSRSFMAVPLSSGSTPWPGRERSLGLSSQEYGCPVSWCRVKVVSWKISILQAVQKIFKAVKLFRKKYIS